jgi:hydrocephalus-inducing protein
VPMTINVAGSKEPPIQAVLSFNTIGPKVSVGVAEIRWGNIECLKDSTRTLTITNEGLIPASMKIFLKMARTCYAIAVRDLILDAHESYSLEITANLDDNIVNKDELHIVVDEGENLMVPLVAKGVGTTMFCKHEMNCLDLEVQLTNSYFEKQIVLENKGRRPQQLKWSNMTIKEENLIRLKKSKKIRDAAGPNATIPKSLLPMVPIFTVHPEEITLRPRTATTFTFRGRYFIVI